jgi:prepilin-type N-terminal cleavage/methylation domain-containing protein
VGAEGLETKSLSGVDSGVLPDDEGSVPVTGSKRRLCMRRSEKGFTLIEIMVVLAIIATLVAAVSVGIPMVKQRSMRLQCQRNLSGMGVIFTNYLMEHPGKPKYSGVALFLSFRKNKDIKVGQEKDSLLCPGDMGVTFPTSPEDSEKWDAVILESPPADMCSYAVRDFDKYPMKMDSPEQQIIACDRQGSDGKTPHHEGGLLVLFDSGSAKWMEKDALGLVGDQQIVVGPDSENKDLKQVIGVANSKKD